MHWLDPKWEPSKIWTSHDRLMVASALLEMVERDIRAGRYSAQGRPNFTSVRAVMHEPISKLEEARPAALQMLRIAREERPG